MMATTSEPNPVNTPLKLYAATSGFNGKHFPSYVFAWRLEQNDSLLSSNSASKPTLRDGTTNQGFYFAILEALQHVPSSSHIQIVTPCGSEIYWVFKDSLEVRQQAGYRTKDKSLRPNHKLQRQVDALCLANGIVLSAAEPQTNHEIESRYGVEDDAKQRRKDACEADERD